MNGLPGLPFDEDTFNEITETLKKEAERYREDRERIKQKQKEDPAGTRKENIAVIVCILSFIGFIALITVCMITEPILCMSCFGVVLTVFTVMSIVQHGLSWESWFVPLFPVVGAVLTALPIIDVVQRYNTGYTIFTKRFLIVIMSIAFTFAGLVMIIVPLIKQHVNKKIYTHPVMATCIFIKTKLMHDKDGYSILYAPRWEYTVGKKTYEFQEREYSNISVPNIGEEREILINPDAPDQAYRVSPGAQALFLVGGIMCLAMTYIMIYFEFIAA